MIKPITSESIQALVAMAENDEGGGVQFNAVEALECIGPDVKAAIPALTKLHQTSEHRGIRMGAERALPSIDAAPD